MASPARKKRRTASAPRKVDAQVVPVAEHEGEMYALLQMRSSQHRTNAGKVSLIGGHTDSSDTDSRATAVRECSEEAGITLDPGGLIEITATRRMDVFAVPVSPSSLEIAIAPDARELGDAARMTSARTLPLPDGWCEPLGHAWIARTDLARLSDACTLVANTVKYATAAMDALALADGSVKVATALVSSDHLNEIWRPPGSETAAAVYVGSQKAAAGVEILKRLGITHIVNCKSRGPKQKHPGIEYYQFPIQQWKQRVTEDDGETNAQEFFAPVIQFIQTALDAGGGCLIHCEHGKHRAGTTGVAWLMHVEDLTSAEATKLAQQRRPEIDPSAEYELQSLLELLDKEQTATPDAASATTATEHSEPAPDTPTSQQAAMDAVYHQSLQSLTLERLDFVRQDEQWPAIRTSHNKLAVPDEKPRTKKVWHSQRTRFIIQTYVGMHGGDGTDMETLMNNMFDNGDYSWIKDTARVIPAVQRVVPAKTRAKAFIALSHLCEVKCGAYLAETSFDDEYKTAKMSYVEFAKNPDNPPPMHPMAPFIGGLTALLIGLFVSVPAGGIFAVGTALHVARQMKIDAHDALDAGEYDRARQLMMAAQDLERDGFSSSDDESPPPIDPVPAILHKKIRVTRLVDCSSSDEEPPPPLNKGPSTTAKPATSEIGVKALQASMGQMSLDEPADPPAEKGDATAVSSVNVVEDDFTAGCPPKPYSGRAPTAEERRTWEAAATRYYQNLLSKYQQAIERLRVTAHEFLQQDGLDVSTFVERHNSIARKTGLKGGLEATRAYFALATMYGDVGGSYEPERLDWYRAQYTSELPDPLPAKCMFVHVTETAVTMVLRDGNKCGQDVDQNLSQASPQLANMLRLWMPYAASAQAGKAYPHVIFQFTSDSYGACYGDGGPYGKLIKRAFKTADMNPQKDADKEWAPNDRHGLGCDWARKVVGRARRGVVCQDGEKHDDAAAATQGHAPTTERSRYRAV